MAMSSTVRKAGEGRVGGLRSEEKMWILQGYCTEASIISLAKVTSDENLDRRVQYETCSVSSCDFVHFPSANFLSL